MNNIILLYGTSQGVGKTTLAKELISRKIVNTVDSFAVYIKKLSYDLHNAVSSISMTKEEFYQTKKDEKIFNRKICYGFSMFCF